ncbi:LysR family transcriptional regulator [Taklimakanibacter lacteus]|uniref:LysR family transcriptional regulator n=1 Tax=Taklimakanibacter lacteus TaxID=2268456 RepID=UPI000E6721B5
MDLHHIRYFLAVSETLNFTRAAEACNVTQPALSRAVQQLEEEVGGQLFRRERNFTHLTDLGMLMRPRLQQILATVGEAKREARQFLTLENAQIKVGIMCSVGPTRFTGLLADFRMRYPGISLELIEGMPSALAARLEKGEIDIAVMAWAEGYPERLDLKPLYRERFLLACPTGHRFTRMNAVRMQEVHGENYLLRLNCEYADNIENLIRETGGAVHICYQSEREDWIQNMVAGGLGICFIPEFSVMLPGLELRPVIEPDVWREINLVTMSGRRMSPALASFIKAVRDYPWPASRFDTI